MPKALSLLTDTYTEWSQDNVSRLAAALAYYTIFSIAPLLVLLISIVGLVAGHIWGPNAAHDEVIRQVHSLVGPDAAKFIGTLVENAATHGSGIAMVVSIALLLYGATNVFASLQNSLDTIWEVKPRPGLGIMGVLRSRLLSFAMILGIAFILMVSLVISTALSALTKHFGGEFPSFFWRTLEQVVSLGLFTLIFAAIYKILPDVKIGWRSVWVGAALTAVLFTVGKYLIGLYLGRSTTASVYGGAGSLVVLLLWVYYSSQILFIGAEFTQVYARRHGHGIRAADTAVKLTESDRIHQGMPHEQTVDKALAASEFDPRRDIIRVPVRVGPTTFLIAAAALTLGFAAGGASRLFKSRDHATRQAAAHRTRERIRELHARLQQGQHLATYLREADAQDRLDLLERRLRHATQVASSK
jgi:membrane protein